MNGCYREEVIKVLFHHPDWCGVPPPQPQTRMCVTSREAVSRKRRSGRGKWQQGAPENAHDAVNMRAPLPRAAAWRSQFLFHAPRAATLAAKSRKSRIIWPPRFSLYCTEYLKSYYLFYFERSTPLRSPRISRECSIIFLKHVFEFVKCAWVDIFVKSKYTLENNLSRILF